LSPCLASPAFTTATPERLEAQRDGFLDLMKWLAPVETRGNDETFLN